MEEDEDLVVDTRGDGSRKRMPRNGAWRAHEKLVAPPTPEPSRVKGQPLDLFFFFRIRQRVPMRTGLLINRRNRRGGMEEGRGRAWPSSVAIFYKADGRNKLKIKSTERRRSGVATSR